MANLETFRQDGKSVDVTVVAATEKGQPVNREGFTGVALGTAASGETVAIEVESRVHALSVGSLSAAKGDKIYITAAGALSTTNTDTLFGKVVRAKDSNSIAWIRLTSQ